MEQTREDYKTRNELSLSLEKRLASVKRFQGEYEREQDYLKVLERIKDTNPFSVLVFYEPQESKLSLPKRKKLNPSVPERILTFHANYAQFYFMPESGEMRVGTYLGSGYRSTQSAFALALALLSEEKDIPTHVLISDRQNKIKHVLSSEKLIVQPHEVTQTVDRETADRILKNTVQAYERRCHDEGKEGSIELVYTLRQ